MRARQALATFVGLFLVSLIIANCSAPRSAPALAAADQQSGGEMKLVVSVKDLMRDFIDSVGIVSTEKNVVETEPQSDADWEQLRVGATMLAEGASLLKVPRPFAPEGDVNNSMGPDPEELSPTQIQATLDKKLDQDPKSRRLAGLFRHPAAALEHDAVEPGHRPVRCRGQLAGD